MGREGEGKGREGEAFYLSRKTLTTKMGGVARCKVVGANETAF